MEIAATSSAELDFAIESAQFGFAALDENLIVRERRGALARWLPEVGSPCTQSGLLFAMDSLFVDLRAPGAKPVRLPSVGIGDAMGERVNISIGWNLRSRRYVVVVAPDDGTEQMDRLLIQQRRERQVLQQQAAAIEDRLRVSTALYREIVETTDDAVLRFGPDLTLSFVSAPASALIGIGRESALGGTVRELLPLPGHENRWRADMCASGPASFEQPVRRADGQTRWVWWSVRWLGEDDGPREFQAVGRDVTETRRLRAELEKANEDAKFAALAQERLRIAHDLHDTFIHSIVTTLARLSLMRRSAPDGALKQEIEEAERETRAGLRQAREAVGALRADFEYPDGPARSLIAAGEALRPRMEVELQIDDDLGPLPRAQTTAIVRIAREALRNVERHSGARRVEIQLARSGDGVRLRIADDGIGMDPRRSSSGHYGLVGMAEQARFAGGALEIAAAPLGGVEVRLALPAS